MSAKPCTVAFLTDAPRVAGSELWLLDVLPLLSHAQIRPTVFLRQLPALDELARRFGEAGVPVERYAELSQLPERTRHADLRVLQGWTPGTYRALLPALPAPRMVISHDQLDFHYPFPLRWSYLEVYPWTKAGPFRWADSVLTVSEWAGTFMRRQMRLPDVKVVTNGVRVETFCPATPGERRDLRRAFGFRRFTVLVPGRFAPEKNQLAALLAARQATDLDFVFVGDMDSGIGQLARTVKQRLGIDNAQFWGRRWDMPELYRAADVLLQPTLAENQSLVTLEAMSSGLPVVTSTIPAQRELVQDGVSGLLVPPNPALLATALKALAAHPERAQAIGRAARDFVLEKHRLEQTAQKLAPLLLEAAESDGARP